MSGESDIGLREAAETFGALNFWMRATRFEPTEPERVVLEAANERAMRHAMLGTVLGGGGALALARQQRLRNVQCLGAAVAGAMVGRVFCVLRSHATSLELLLTLRDDESRVRHPVPIPLPRAPPTRADPSRVRRALAQLAAQTRHIRRIGPSRAVQALREDQLNAHMNGQYAARENGVGTGGLSAADSAAADVGPPGFARLAEETADGGGGDAMPDRWDEPAESSDRDTAAARASLSQRSPRPMWAAPEPSAGAAATGAAAMSARAHASAAEPDAEPGAAPSTGAGGARAAGSSWDAVRAKHRESKAREVRSPSAISSANSLADSPRRVFGEFARALLTRHTPQRSAETPSCALRRPSAWRSVHVATHGRRCGSGAQKGRPITSPGRSATRRGQSGRRRRGRRAAAVGAMRTVTRFLSDLPPWRICQSSRGDKPGLKSCVRPLRAMGAGGNQ